MMVLLFWRSMFETSSSCLIGGGCSWKKGGPPGLVLLAWFGCKFEGGHGMLEVRSVYAVDVVLWGKLLGIGRV